MAVRYQSNGPTLRSCSGLTQQYSTFCKYSSQLVRFPQAVYLCFLNYSFWLVLFFFRSHSPCVSTRHGQKVTVLSVVLAFGSNACPDKCVLVLSAESGVVLSDRSVIATFVTWLAFKLSVELLPLGTMNSTYYQRAFCNKIPQVDNSLPVDG